MSCQEVERWKEHALEELEELAYLYSKTSLYDYARRYHALAEELLSSGVKPEHLPIIRKGASNA